MANMRKPIRIGHSHSYLTVIGYAEPVRKKTSKRFTHKVICRCACGNETAIRESDFKTYEKKGTPMSCGCYRVSLNCKRGLRHGMAETPTYNAWKTMRRRCDNPAFPNFKYWGGRGITYVERWKSFENFLSDMGIRPDGHTLDRTDNDRGYSPENCRWATMKEQAQNRRPKGTA